MSKVFSFISSICSVSDNPIIDALVMGVICYLAYKIAWVAGSVGDNSFERKCFHWAVRIPTFFVLFGIAKAISYIFGF